LTTFLVQDIFATSIPGAGDSSSYDIQYLLTSLDQSTTEDKWFFEDIFALLDVDL
jgi:hypothetical protein